MRFRRLAFGLARSSVRSDTGVEIRVGIPYVTYSEGDYGLKVGRELAFRAVESMRWEPPHSDEQISQDKRKQIANTIKAALEYLKIDYEVY